MISATTLFRYISGLFLRHLGILIAVLMAVVYILDVVEIMRRGSTVSGGGLSLGVALGMGGLKLPIMGQRMIPFATLFAAIYTCWRLNKTSELVVIRAAGMSAWQFLSPMIVCAFLFGVAATTVINPISAGMVSKYDRMEKIYLNAVDNLVTISRTGIWLRQPAEGGYALLHAASFDHSDWRFADVTVFYFSPDDQFLRRLDAPAAYLRDGYWELDDVAANADNSIEILPQATVPTTLTANKLQDSLSDPDTVSFWKIPDYLKVMEETGFPTSSLHIHFQALLAQPLMLVSMVLLAAAFSLRPPRFGGQALLIALGVGAGFFIFFMESMLHAFGISQKIPVFLAAWTPAAVSLLLGTTALLHLEDG